MILIDAIYTHQTGGKVLLDYLVSEIEKTDAEVFYLFDDRISKDSYKIKPTNKFLFEKSTFFKRFSFYRKNKDIFSKVLCFGNIPPPIKINAIVYTFLHQRIYLEIPRELPLKTRFSFFIKTEVVKLFKDNTDYWLVQNENIKLKLNEKFKVDKNHILNLPFYPSVKGEKEIERNNFGFIYISHPFPHKNHLNLIDAFCLFYDLENKGQLVLTVDRSYKELCDYIDEKIAKGYPIKNIGFVNRDDLYQYYRGNRYLIFPSLTESFGLGIIEAIENGCDIIGANLPYTYEVCEPSLIFDPNNVQSIKDSIIQSIDFHNVKRSKLKVKDKIQTLIKLLTK
ncbi:glycosyltransferase [Chryseobacterium daecheongense]|uniref:glycosyltransferase n=1 Tax=Chryseobacterium daecheongense TaxID=192389 RepID=UPI001FD6EB51|nr:glycosyltransferase [Chryseobacterium daecheongense]UOU96723.1 glycosyltransferase [Chryseobacterium daecheongense]